MYFFKKYFFIIHDYLWCYSVYEYNWFYDQKITFYYRWSGNGYDHGFEPDHIIGANEEDDVVIFFVEWKLSENGLLVGQNWIEAREIYEKHPQVAIQFFEEHLQFCCEE